MKNFNSIFVFFIIVFLFGSCKPQQKPLNFININDAQGIRKYTTLYTLPKTLIRLNIKVEKASYKKGPYHQYANSLLGLNDVITEDKASWSLTDFDFECIAIPDTTQIYLIETDDNLNSIELKMNSEGFLEAICPVSNEFLNSGTGIKKFNNLEVSGIKHQTSINKEINFDEVPLPKELYTKKSTSEEAAFLANRILSLRDDRAAILVGDGYTQNIPEGDALKAMLKSIDRIQEKYLSMFIGKTQKEYFDYSFDFIPTEARKKTQIILFRFSEQFGLVDNNDVSGMPMIMQIESLENLKLYEQFKKKQGYLIKLANKKGKDEEKEKGLFYRIPEEAFVRLIADDKTLGQKQIQLAQFGSIHSLPVQYLDGSYTVELYPELGSIKSIVKKENKQVEKNKK